MLNEILQSVTTIAKGQWGNWVIQHILEHGTLADRAIVTQKILEDAVNLSLDQYASKVVEKTLRTAAQHSFIITAASSLVGATTSVISVNNISDENKDNNSGSGDKSADLPTVTVNGTTIHLTQEEVITLYIKIVCDGVQDRPRIPLIDIAADPYGNHIVQYILTNAGLQHRETCAALIKRHMVSLRGSKYGQKVAFMVERWRGGAFSNNNNYNNSGNNNGSNNNGHYHYNNNNNNNGGHGSFGTKSGSMDGSNNDSSSGGGGGGGGGGRQRW